MTDKVKVDRPSDAHRGFRIAAIGLMLGFAGVAIAFFDPTTGDGGSGGFFFKAGFAVAVIGILLGIFGSVIHFASLGDHGGKK